MALRSVAIWLAMITSAANRGWHGDVAVSDLPLAGLPIASIIRPAKIATIEAKDAERLGSLAEKDRSAVTSYFSHLLAAVLG